MPFALRPVLAAPSLALVDFAVPHRLVFCWPVVLTGLQSSRRLGLLVDEVCPVLRPVASVLELRVEMMLLHGETRFPGSGKISGFMLRAAWGLGFSRCTHLAFGTVRF